MPHTQTALGAAINMTEVTPVQLHCNDSQFSELGTMFLNPQEGAIIQLFSRGTAGYFTPLFPCAQLAPPSSNGAHGFCAMPPVRQSRVHQFVWNYS